MGRGRRPSNRTPTVGATPSSSDREPGYDCSDPYIDKTLRASLSHPGVVRIWVGHAKGQIMNWIEQAIAALRRTDVELVAHLPDTKL